MANIVVLCSNNRVLGDSEYKTGVSLLELTPIFHELESADHSIDLVSPLGGEIPIDNNSIDMNHPIVRDYYERTTFLQKLKTTKPLQDIKHKKYSAIIACGGWSCIGDFLEQNVANQISELNADYWVLVGYSQCLLLAENFKKKCNHLKIAAPTKDEDTDIGFQKIWKLSLADELNREGYTLNSGKSWSRHVVESDFLITGQNIFSAQASAEILVKKLKTGV